MSPGSSSATDRDPAPPTTAESSPGPAAIRLLGGRYAILGRLGAGGMATILRARDTVLDREVAIKVVHAHLADDPGVLGRFRTEARHAARLAHPNIVAVYDQGMADLPYIVMELVDGPSLRDILIQRGSLTPAEALAVIQPLSAGLSRAHQMGVVHRDIKPENVLVSSVGLPKLADFGIARAAAATSHTSTGTLVGSVHYMAPELVDGRQATPASDVYAVGVLLYELLTGRKPLPADTPMAVALRHAGEVIPAPSAHDPSIPPAVDAVVARATAHDPEERYADVAEVGAALSQAVPGGSTPVTVADDDGHERTLILPAERQDTMAVAAATDLASRRKESARPHGAGRGQQQRPRRRRRLRRAGSLVLVLLLLAGVAGAGFLVYDRALAPAHVVPALEGLSREAAFAELDALDLGLIVAGEEPDLEIPDGHVLSQDPPADGQLRAGNAVQVVLSTGPEVVAMPEVLGLQRQAATALLDEEFFEVVVSEEFHDTAPRDTVIGQLPDPESPTAQGEVVNVTVSLGIEQVEVPSLGGLTRGEAVAVVERAKLVPEVTETYSDEVPSRDMVVSQGLEPGTTVDKNSVVEVVVSRGPNTIEMPNVIGDKVDEASDELEELGLEVVVDTQPVPRFGPIRGGREGRVEVQSPSPGADVHRGDTVRLGTYVDDD